MESDSISLIIIVLCVIMSAYFSATETAFSSFNRIRVKNMAEKGDKKANLVMKLAEDAARVLGLEAYCRLDFMMKENGDVYCLEANTLPGMTPTSLIPQEAAVLGLDYPSLCEELIRVSKKKYQSICSGQHEC